MIRQSEFVALAVLAIAVSGVVVLVVVVVVVVVVSFCCFFPGLAEKSYHGGDMGGWGVGSDTHAHLPHPACARMEAGRLRWVAIRGSRGWGEEKGEGGIDLWGWGGGGL